MFNVTAIPVTVAPAGMPLTAIVLVRPVTELSGIARLILPEETVVEVVVTPPDAVNTCELPLQILGDAGVTVTVAGEAFTRTDTLAVEEEHPFAVAMKVYDPVAATVAEVIDGF
jgi:hypothetical protein